MARKRDSEQLSFMNAEGHIDKILERSLEKILPESMMPYSEAVIMDRAIPRIEDGLKPVQRRILYSMFELNLMPDKEFKKSARVVGDCLGKYHPHGDSSVYDAMVRMAQDFNMRLRLVQGHGNFGSVDGDGAAAMRYTEVKLAPLALELLKDLDCDTVDWQKNFDDSLNEPRVLPGRFPNLLVNGGSGIAIGLATDIPPHNLTEVIDAVVAMIDNPRIPLSDLLKIVKGPDFPTGGYIVESDPMEEIYSTGKGKFVMRGKVDIENADGGKQSIVITEIPYQVNKSKLAKDIYDLRESNKAVCGGISDVVDESDRSGMRLVVKLKKGEDAAKILEVIYKKTELQKNYNANMVAIANGKPEQLGLVDMLRYYIEYQRKVVLRRTQFNLNIAKKRENILNGFVTVYPAIREVVEIILDSKSRTESKTRIRERFSLNEAQADAILDTRLAALNQLDVEKIYKELDELRKKIAVMEKITASKKEQLNVVRTEILEIRNKYKVKRLTTVVKALDDIEIKTYDPTKRNSKRGYVAVSADGRVKFMTTNAFYKDDRSAAAATPYSVTRDLKMVEPSEQAVVFGSLGNAYRIDVNAVPEKKWNDRGNTLKELSGGEAPDNEKAVSVMIFGEKAEDVTVYAYTRGGVVKATKMAEYSVNKPMYQYCVLKDGDEIIGVEKDIGLSTIMFVSTDGQAFNCLKDEIPLQGRKAGGVCGMKLADGAKVVYAGQVPAEYETEEEIVTVGELLTVCANGMGRKGLTRSYRPMQRAKKGVKALDLPPKQRVIFATVVLDDVDLAMIDVDGTVKTVNTEDVRLNDRNTRAYLIEDGTFESITVHKEET